MLYFIFVGGSVATAAMTLFSLMVSLVFKQLYREPVLINLLLPQKITKYSVLGYLIHFAVGWILALVYYFLTIGGFALLSFQIGLIFGLISGLLAIAAWMVFFKLSKHPPKINLTGYFLQLLLAHLIFGGTLAWVVMQ